MPLPFTSFVLPQRTEGKERFSTFHEIHTKLSQPYTNKKAPFPTKTPRLGAIRARMRRIALDFDRVHHGVATVYYPCRAASFFALHSLV